ncbi:MAG: ribonuclease HIII, partial [Lentisphaeria bacterium]|nr:ribonuclease HIII [Lentisphaeria bacterium]
EPYITGVELPEEQEPFSPHAGIDESGKGDFFGPLVVSCVYVENEDVAEKLSALGVRDSKQIKSDKKIAGIASEIMKLVQGKFAIVVIGPEAYNRAYAKIGSLNRLLAWGHARSLENLLEKAPECPAALADKFGDEHLIRNALLENGRKIHLDQRTKAESDIAVAAASILARAEFVRRLEALAGIAGVDTLPKGAGSQVDSVAAQIAGSGGAELLEKISKRHFTTFEKALKNGKS